MSEDEDWRDIKTAPKDGTLVRLWCPGEGSDPKPREYIGRFTDGGWLSNEGDRTRGLIRDPLKWKPLKN